MFGNVAIYTGDKIILATRQKEENPIDNGIWVGTKEKYHNELKELFPALRNLKTYGIKSWLLLPEDADDFEEVAYKITTLIKQNSPLIGNVPPERKPRKKRSK